MDGWLVTVKEFMKLKTPTDRLIFFLFGAVVVLATWANNSIEVEKKTRLEERTYYDLKFKEQQASHAIELHRALSEADEARRGISECEKESLKWAKELLAEQTAASGKGKKITKTQNKIAVENRQLTNTVGEQQKELIEKLKE